MAYAAYLNRQLFDQWLLNNAFLPSNRSYRHALSKSPGPQTTKSILKARRVTRIALAVGIIYAIAFAAWAYEKYVR